MFLTPFLILAAKLLFLLASIAMQKVAVCGIRNGLRFGNLTPSPILPNLHPCIIAAPYQGALNPRLAFILGRTALIFQNRFAFTSFFINFANGKDKQL